MSSETSVARLSRVTKSFRVRGTRQPTRKFGARGPMQRFVAVDDISLELARGEVIGLVGPNGAGKSTLLKILSRVMHPDEGRVTLNGPIMSLLEVGAGFHPELTARENVFLNGAILGLDRRTVQRSFADIVGLAGVEPFLETPVKRFSSGMRVRLAIAVGLHLDCDAIVLDEVLSVGDADFQRKCLQVLDRMVTHEGRGALLVSHNMQTIRQACSRVLVLERGRVVFDGDPDEAVESYFHHVGNVGQGTAARMTARTNPHGTNQLHVRSLRLVDGNDRPLVPVTEGPLGFAVELDVTGLPSRFVVSIRLGTRSAPHVASIEHTIDLPPSDVPVSPMDLRWFTPLTPLAVGQYTVSVTLRTDNGSPLDAATDVLTFTVTDPAQQSGSLTAGLTVGHVVLEGDWHMVRRSEG